MNLYSFVSITRHKFLSTCQIVVSKEFWRFFDAVRGFDINSAPESNRLFSGNGGCVYPLAFLHKLLRRLHYCRGFGNCEEELPKKPVSRLSVNCRPTVGRLSADSWPTDGRQVLPEI